MPVKLRVFQDFCVDVQLPYAAVRSEESSRFSRTLRITGLLKLMLPLSSRVRAAGRIFGDCCTRSTRRSDESFATRGADEARKFKDSGDCVDGGRCLSRVRLFGTPRCDPKAWKCGRRKLCYSRMPKLIPSPSPLQRLRSESVSARITVVSDVLGLPIEGLESLVRVPTVAGIRTW